jgi:hypothetical protein
MDERRKSHRDRVIYGGVVTAIDSGSATRSCVIRNLSPEGAGLEFGSALGVPETIDLTIAKTAHTRRSKIVWQRGNLAGATFVGTPDAANLDARLRKSEKKKRQLQLKIETLLGGA